MIDLNNIVQGLSKSGAVSGFAGGLAGTAVAGALTGKKGKKMAKSALKVGALAAVGGLAYSAYRRYQQQKTEPTASPASAGAAGRVAGVSTPLLGAAGSSNDRLWSSLGEQQFADVVADEHTTSGALLLVRAMITAAASDGHMDAQEQQRIFGEANRMDLSADEKATLFDELQRPMSREQIIAQVRTPETAIEVYTASLVSIDPTRRASQNYLAQLAADLELPDELVASIHEQVQLAAQEEAAA